MRAGRATTSAQTSNVHGVYNQTTVVDVAQVVGVATSPKKTEEAVTLAT